MSKIFTICGIRHRAVLVASCSGCDYTNYTVAKQLKSQLNIKKRPQ